MPEPDRHVVNDHLVLNRFRVPVQRLDSGVWVTAPSMGVRPPISLSIFRDWFSDRPDADAYHEFLHLHLSVNWSLWWQDGSAGRAMLDQALARLHTHGWRWRPAATY